MITWRGPCAEMVLAQINAHRKENKYLVLIVLKKIMHYEPRLETGNTVVWSITFHPKALKQFIARQVFWLPCADAFPSAWAESGLECRLSLGEPRNGLQQRGLLRI